jgi:hypothetical protein
MGFMISTPTLKSRTGEGKLVAVRVGIVRATRGDRDAEINTMHALLNEMNMNESHEKEYVEVGVDKHLCCLPFKKIDAITAVAMAEQVKIDTKHVFMHDGCSGCRIQERHACYRK